MARKEEEQLRFQARLLEAVGQSVIATDLEGKVLYWNRAAEETLRLVLGGGAGAQAKGLDGPRGVAGSGGGGRFRATGGKNLVG